VLTSAPGQPAGDVGCALDLQVPIASDGRLDVEAFVLLADHCHVHLVQSELPVWSSPLLRSDGAWKLRPGSTEESPLWQLRAHTMRPGDYLTLLSPDVVEQTFRIVNATPL
jgi:hypothetical protein